MLRGVMYLIVSLLVLTLARAVVGILAKGFSQMFESPGSKPATTAATAGELKKDPVCGTFVPESTSVKKTVRGEVVHFCSITCRDKHQSG